MPHKRTVSFKQQTTDSGIGKEGFCFMPFKRSSKFILLALPLAVGPVARGDLRFVASSELLHDGSGGPESGNLQPAAATSASWNSDADGSWSNPTNWSAPVPNAIDASATFGSAITAPRVITVDSPEVVGTISFNNVNRYTLGGPQTLVLASSTNQASISTRPLAATRSPRRWCWRATRHSTRAAAR